MADELNPAIIKRTQETLGKYVKKPSLTEKLLKKPPFRFLHDVFSVVIRDTGCFDGLYTPEELTYENIKDRDDKMKFLQKMIDVVRLTTGSSLAVRTSKIVAGHEADKTNELLQLMGEIIDKKLDWQAALEQVLSGKTASKASPRKPKEKVSKDTTTKDKHKEKSKEKDSKIKEPKIAKTTSSKTVASTKKDEKSKLNKTKEKPITKSVAKERPSKGNKEPDKPVKRSTKETSNTKTKLTKTESQSSNKSSPSPITQESTKEQKSVENKTECKHEEMTQIQQMENVKVATPPRKSSNSSINNEITNINEDVVGNQQDSLQSSSHLEEERRSAGKSKKSSAKTRKSSARKVVESFGETVQDIKTANNLESYKGSSTPEKSDTTKATDMSSSQQELVTVKVNQHQDLIKQMESETVKNIEPKTSPQTQTQKPIQTQASPPASLTNEMKRESTFTRENSKESSSNQSSLVNRPRTSLRPPSARPPSARPGAPRRRDKNIEIVLQPNDQIKMSGIQVKLETFGDLDDDGDNLVIIENPNTNDITTDQQTNLTESEKMMQDETLEQGHLVQQILETQKELVQNDVNNQQKNDKDSTNGLVMRQTSARNMNNLRDVIQNLTKSVNPLGKLMDFIPEDVDAMQLEFTMCRDAYTQAANELKREKSLTESATEPMKNQLVQIEANITEYMEMIDASRVKILQNSEKILKMLIN
ncbi:TRAF3-interacting protein 1 [Lucilia sericata]|uniref:TRAF3-interacting protein 1 n=1 Tax=Lucilia sericata TaxID=13632 RepID=UPI0018A7F66C|nr:TRAF3-interacting protein 1 [Lucilia sericata]